MRSLVISGLLAGLGLVARWTNAVPALTTQVVFIVAMWAGGWFLLPKAWRAVRRRQPDINLLMVVAVIGATIIGEWAEAATVVFLFGVAEWLEGWADRRAHRAIAALLEITPRTATVRREGQFIEVDVKEV
ncbi:MAG: cation-transporting P-type ATPase, partial [Opitutaceae bacterium]